MRNPLVSAAITTCAGLLLAMATLSGFTVADTDAASSTVADLSGERRRPLDLILVVDHSGSLAFRKAWGDVQRGTVALLSRLDETRDRVGLISFSTLATSELSLQNGFLGAALQRLEALRPEGWSNTGEALHLAHLQFAAAPPRREARRVVVLFTDGPPTALRTGVGGEAKNDMVLAVGERSTRIAGYWARPALIGDPRGALRAPAGCQQSTICLGIWDADLVRAQAARAVVQALLTLQRDGAEIYVITLRDPSDDAMEFASATLRRAIPPGSRPIEAAVSPAEIEPIFESLAERVLGVASHAF